MAAQPQHITAALTAAEIYETARIRNLWMDAADPGIHSHPAEKLHPFPPERPGLAGVGKVPPLLHFSNHTNRQADFYPTLNQTRLTVERTDAPSELQVYLETETPCFDGYLAKTDDGLWHGQQSEFRWSIHKGLNILQVRSRNTAGVEGIVSALAVEV